MTETTPARSRRRESTARTTVLLENEGLGYPVEFWTTTDGKLHTFIERRDAIRRWVGTQTLAGHNAALPSQRHIRVMFEAGQPGDEVLGHVVAGRWSEPQSHVRRCTASGDER